MSSALNIPKDCSKQWEVLLLLLASEEKKVDKWRENEIDTMIYFGKNKGVRACLGQWLSSMEVNHAEMVTKVDAARKNDEISLLWRQMGNENWRNNNVDESYICYSKSVSYAEQNGPMFPLALGNRSAALMKMKQYKKCLSDVTLAIESGYPPLKLHKMMLRKAECQIELKQKNDAKESLSAAVELSKQNLLTPVELADFEKQVKNLEKKIKDIKDEDAPTPEMLPPDCVNGVNPEFSAASKDVGLLCSGSAGRYVVAKADLKSGDVVFSEEPYAWVTLPHLDDVCEMCCDTGINPLPCEVCTRSVYCSVECRSKAKELFHGFECLGMQSDIIKTIGIAHLALRTLLLSAKNGFPPLPSGLPPPAKAFDLFRGYACLNKVAIYHKNIHPFYRMFNLVTNFDKMPNGDYIQYAVTASMLTMYLEYSTVFMDCMQGSIPYNLPYGEVKLFAAALLLRFTGQLVCNGHATMTLTTVMGKADISDMIGVTVSEKEVRKATAVYPSAAMMNHSCDPNIINTFYRKRLVVRCARALSAGGELSNCYGPHRARQAPDERRQALRSQYYFDCACVACTDPERRDALLIFSAYACQSCRGPVVIENRFLSHPQCQHCDTNFPLDRALAVLEHADERVVQAKRSTSLEERCEIMQSAYRMKQLILHRHNIQLRTTADKLARLYADAGDFARSLELIKQNIQSLEYQFGSFSVEVAHELRKLSDVMLERLMKTPDVPEYRDWCLESHKVLKKAIKLMELNYGTWEPVVHQLRGRERLVAGMLARCRAGDGDWVHHNLHYNLKI